MLKEVVSSAQMLILPVLFAYGSVNSCVKMECDPSGRVVPPSPVFAKETQQPPAGADTQALTAEMHTLEVPGAVPFSPLLNSEASAAVPWLNIATVSALAIDPKVSRRTIAAIRLEVLRVTVFLP